jgi:outer membrane protein OmpA-like peptidoglycan-associated protein
VVPLPGSPPGPKIHRVSHDAREPVSAGDRIEVTVLAEKNISVEVRLGTESGQSPCRPDAARPGTYRCPLAIPLVPPGTHRLVALAVDRDGRRSTLSSILPLTVRERDPWLRVNALNVRLRPVYFASGSAHLHEEARATLGTNRVILAENADLSIAIEGHCDSAEEGDHQELSLKRAEAALAHLASLGIPRERMILKPLADSEPVAAGEDEAKALNRRVMILFDPAGEAAGP